MIMMQKVKLLCAAAALLLSAHTLRAGEDADSVAVPITYNLELNATVSGGDNTPFWLVNNRNGLSSIEKNNGYFRAGMFREAVKPSHEKRFSWGFGADVAATWNFSSSFVIQQLYGEIRYRCLGLTVGAKQRYNEGFQNNRLSSGNLLFSPNARPIPQARIAIPDYVDVPFTNKWLAVKADLAFGAFTDQRWQKSWVADSARRTRKVLFHEKSLDIRIGNRDHFPLVFEGRLAMAAQFGGQSIAQGKTTNMSHGIKDWWKVISAQGGDSDVPEGEQKNSYGNHVGDWNFRLTYAPKDAEWAVKAYYDHFFEDHSMMFFNYKWRDMLLGFEGNLPHNPFVSNIAYEYLYTKNQSGPVFWNNRPNHPEQVSGRDDYYNHQIYTGWQHWGMGIGNPLLLSPIYNKDHLIYFHHNRLIAHHLGFDGNPTPWLSWRVLLTYTRSWGTYDVPTANVEKNFNTLVEVTYTPTSPKLSGWSATLGLATDGGDMIGQSRGAMLTIRKTGIICKTKR